MHWILELTLWLRHFATQVPLDVFVFVGSFIEEIIGPIPSTAVMTTAGVIARLEHHTFVYVLWLALFGNLGKTLATYVYYFIGDKGEDLLTGKFGRLLKIRHEDIERIGKTFGQNHWKDGGLLFLARLIPFFPTMVVSIGCGVIKMNLRVYLLATYLGNFFKDLLYIYAGYGGVWLVHGIWRRGDRIGFHLDLFLLLIFLAVFFYMYFKGHRGRRVKNFFARYFEK